MREFCQHLLDSSGFPPRWQCGSWSPGLGWLHIAADLGVWSAYFVIPCVLAWYAVRRKDIPFRGVVLLFVAFILLCGLTHLMDAVLFWWPAYRLAALLKLATALVSWATVASLFRITPHLMALRAPSELDAEIGERRRAEQDLRVLQASLERRVAERTAALEETEERFRAVFEATPAGLILADRYGRIVLVNDLIVRMFGWEKAELLGQPVERLVPERFRDRHPAYRAAYFATPAERPMGAGRDLAGARKDGSEFPVEVGIRPVGMSGAMYVLASVIDISTRKQAEANLRASEERFQAFMNHAPLAAWMVDEEFRGVYASPGFDRLTGLSPGSLLGRTPSELFPAGVAARHTANSNRVLSTGLPVGDEEPLVGLDGFPGVAYVVKFPVRGPSGQTLIGSVAIDITERKRTEELIKASLREKEVLLKEIHHRVKNNLQIVSALLELQSRQTTDRAAVEMFRESRGRVKSMALIHERLYRSLDLARVDFAEYTRQLAGDLFRTYKVSGDIRLEIDVDIPALSIDIAIPCGLLLNELISNCLKHAFAAAADGCIRVALHRERGTNVVTVADDGVGFPAGTDFRNSTSFGLQLVNTLVEQLAGESVMTADRGTTVTVRFPGTPSSNLEGPNP
ncbi:sensor histidine kinase [Frigoriglobus tundricola]|uniref:Two-component system sensor histidine kinase n=1 Tax=Frigoriglobus tundricola TaxID=2774151 RepID=A0A6M5YR84_9BACT|nr:PAS domain S-box protein [Frigoriglobus tundricola]QJW95803.1 Two-component system sensor histidine kinase [Frigoriglobus tundricola]